MPKTATVYFKCPVPGWALSLDFHFSARYEKVGDSMLPRTPLPFTITTTPTPVPADPFMKYRDMVREVRGSRVAKKRYIVECDPSIKIEGIEKVGDEDCYVISGSQIASMHETYWISKSSYLIKKYDRVIENTAELHTIVPEMTDEQLEASLNMMGQKVTEESKKNLRETMENARTTAKTSNMKIMFSEIHENILSPKLHKSDFKFDVPEGTVLKDSLFGGVLAEGSGTSNEEMNDGN